MYLLISYYNFITGKSIQVPTKDLNKYLSTLQSSLSKDSSNPTTHFELACFYSLIEDRNNAYKHLGYAVTYGYKKIENIQTEPDLRWLRSQDDFNEYAANGYKFGNPKTPTVNDEKINLFNNNTIICCYFKCLGNTKKNGRRL